MAEAESIKGGMVMRTRVTPHALSDHAAFAALTAMQRGRLEHIARSMPTEHSTASRSKPKERGLHGRPLLRRWVMVVAAAEALGFLGPAIVGTITTSAADSVVVPAMLAAGLYEGTVLGVGQALVLRRAIPGLSMPRWVLATAVGAVLAYALGLLPSSLGGDWSQAVTIAGSIVLGVLIVMTIGGTQWLVLRRHLDGAYRWILITAIAWLLGLAALFGLSTPLWQAGQSLVITIAIGVCGGLLMAAVTAWLTGVGLLKLMAASDR
jgi:hypothetical protein